MSQEELETESQITEAIEEKQCFNKDTIDRFLNYTENIETYKQDLYRLKHYDEKCYTTLSNTINDLKTIFRSISECKDETDECVGVITANTLNTLFETIASSIDTLSKYSTNPRIAYIQRDVNELNTSVSELKICGLKSPRKKRSKKTKSRAIPKGFKICKDCICVKKVKTK